MSDSASGSGGPGYYFQNGVWLSKGESNRSERFQRWTDGKSKSKVQSLDRQQHSNLVKIHSECLQMRTELRGLQQEKRQKIRRHGSSDSADGADSLFSTSVASSTSSSLGRGMRKFPSTGSIVSASSSGYSSLASGFSGRPIHSSGGDRVLEGHTRTTRLRSSAALNPDVLALKLKNLHSARSLSKLNNDMEIN